MRSTLFFLCRKTSALRSVVHVQKMERKGGVKLETNQLYTKMYHSAIRGGILAALGSGAWVALCVLSVYMNKEGHCFPTQEQVAQQSGVSVDTAKRWLKKLTDFRWNGEPIVESWITRTASGNQKTHYRILPLSQFAIFEGDIDQTNTPQNCTVDTPQICMVDTPQKCPVNKNQLNKNHLTKESVNAPTTESGVLQDMTVEELKNGNAFVKYFMAKYRTKYTVSCSVNFKITTSQMNKLLKRFGADVLKQIVDIYFEEFDERWKKSKYPRETMGALVSFIADDVFVTLEKREQERKQYEQFSTIKPVTLADVEDLF